MLTKSEHSEVMRICKALTPTNYEKRYVIRRHMKLHYNLLPIIRTYDDDLFEKIYNECKRYFLNTKFYENT